MKSITTILPKGFKAFLFKIRGIVFYSGNSRYCPVCKKKSRKFLKPLNSNRENAMCPHCGSLERHRLTWLFFSKKTDLLDGKPKKILHVAPELCLMHMLQNKYGKNYITADLSNPRDKVKMDITDIKYANESFDVIYCSHVLEHVQKDQKAMRELYRVLKPNGWAVLNVPITADKTIEDDAVVDPEERLKKFGQKDHVRRYGPDYLDRLQKAGFGLEISTVKDLVQTEEITLMGLKTRVTDKIFYCTKSKI